MIKPMPIKASHWLIVLAGVAIFVILIAGLYISMFLVGEFSKYPGAIRTCLSDVSVEETYLLFRSCFSTSDNMDQIYDWHAGRGWSLGIARDESVLYGFSETDTFGLYNLQHIEASPSTAMNRIDITSTIKILMVPTWSPFGVPDVLRMRP
jgi:hypothetical protein